VCFLKGLSALTKFPDGKTVPSYLKRASRPISFPLPPGSYLTDLPHGGERFGFFGSPMPRFRSSFPVVTSFTRERAKRDLAVPSMGMGCLSGAQE
jgi:hypothetical protein